VKILAPPSIYHLHCWV